MMYTPRWVCWSCSASSSTAVSKAAQLHLSDISRKHLHKLLSTSSSTLFIQGLLLSLTRVSEVFIKKKFKKVTMTIQPFPSVTSVPTQVLRRKEEREEERFPSVDKLSISSVAADSYCVRCPTWRTGWCCRSECPSPASGPMWRSSWFHCNTGR